ncbi:hypothetical protein HL670_03053 [Serratia plymuthica]|uniref:hypothetical protein n=1 Tax=Serratia plymuthica TaxID=82996 RepID=UPI00148C4BC4|nr:hypothetical protein [Serratia plymuthica]QJW56164.1 hypothetical protein HL670_03053 [Serratia plymuthica]
MQATETHFLDNGYTFNIPPATYRRSIAVPLLQATANSQLFSRATHYLHFKGQVVAKAETGNGVVAAVNSWSGFIEANQSVSIQATAQLDGSDAMTPKCITVLIGYAN